MDLYNKGSTYWHICPFKNFNLVAFSDEHFLTLIFTKFGYWEQI